MWSGAILCWTLGYAAFIVAAIACDLRSRRVPNVLVLLAFGLQTAWLIAQVLGWVGTPALGAPGLVHAFLLFLALLLAFFPVWKLGVMGAGDVKFMAVLGYVAGLPTIVSALLLGSALAGAHALFFVIAGRFPLAILRLHDPAWRRIPYAAYLALGALAWMGWTLAART